MFEFPMLKRHLRADRIADNRIILISETEQILLKGRLYAAIIPLLDGTRSVKQVANTLEGQVSLPEVFYTLTILTEKGYLTERDASSEAPFWQALGAAPAIVRARLSEKPVSISTLDTTDPFPLYDALTQLGVRTAEEGHLHILLTDSYRHSALREVNQNARKPWLLIKPGGYQAWMGPLFIPGETGCWACLKNRLQLNRIPQAAPPQAGLPPLREAILTLAASEVAKWLALDSYEGLVGTLLTFDHRSMITERHQLTRRPQCRVCGSGPRSWAPFRLQSRPKSALAGHREHPPETTVAQLQHHISPITGVVQNLEEVPGKQPGLVYNILAGTRVALAGSRSPTDMVQISGLGKGRNMAQAQASAICEALERYSAVYQGDEPVITASFAEMGDQAFYPNTLMAFSEYQLANRAVLNESVTNRAFMIPDPLDPERPITWAAAQSLHDSSVRYVPAAYVYFGYAHEPRICYANSNGTAAGRSLEEALLHGLLERIERDSIGIWWFNRITRPQVNLESFNEPYFADLHDYYTTLGREIWVLDVTSDLGVPTFAAVSRNTSGEREEIIYGFGAHLDAKAAIVRALTEMNQLLPVVNPPEGEYWSDDPLILRWFREITIEENAYLGPGPGVRTAADYPPLWHTDSHTDVMTLVDVLAKAQLEAYAVNLTRPDIGLSVVKVIVPGMCHFWNRFGARRLYTTPVKLGWLPSPTPEADLNPFPVFF